jgi:hypothetical protein
MNPLSRLGFEQNQRFVLRHKSGQRATDEPIDSHLHASGSLFDSVSCVSNRMWGSDFGCKSGQQMINSTSMNPVQSAWITAEISKAGISPIYPDEELAFALTLVVSLGLVGTYSRRRQRRYNFSQNQF